MGIQARSEYSPDAAVLEAVHPATFARQTQAWDHLIPALPVECRERQNFGDLGEIDPPLSLGWAVVRWHNLNAHE